MRWLARWGAVLAVGSGCLDLQLPSRPGPLTVSGRVVVEEPGTGRKLPAAGAAIELSKSNVSIRAAADGRFTLKQLPSRDATVSVRWDPDGDGRFDFQRLFPVAELLGGRDSGDVQVGDLSLALNGFVRGSVRLAGVVGPRGHGGVSVFVPGYPFTTTTTDDGSYLLRDLPSGRLTVGAFRAGYEVGGSTDIDLQPGQLLEVSTLTLAVATSAAQPAALGGKATRADGSPAAGATVRALVPGGSLAVAADVVASGQAGADGAFSLQLAAGLYDVVISDAGMTSLRQYNVLLVPGGSSDLGALTLVEGQDPPTGANPPVDAGAVDAGPQDAGVTDAGVSDAGAVDAGTDAGPPDAGPPDAGRPNAPPTASARSGVVAAGAVVVLDGTASADPDGDPLLFDWVQTAGDPVLLDINHSTQAGQPHFVAPARGQALGFTLTVTDPGGLRATAMTTLTVDQRPVAVVSPAVLGPPGSTITVDGTRSYDPDNTGPLTFSWTAAAADGGPGPTLTGATTATPSLMLPSADGAQVNLTLTVSDGYVSSLPVAVVAYATNQNVAPTARAGADQTVDQGAMALLDPRASTDPNGPTGLTFAWAFVGQACGTLGTPNGQGVVVYTAPAGDCDAELQLTVTDPGSLRSSDSLIIRVRDQLPPVVATSTPGDQVSGAPAFGPVTFTFQRPVTADVADGGLVVSLPDGGRVAGSTRYDSVTRTVSFVPSLPFELGVVHRATVTATSLQNLPSDGGFTISFDARPPTVQAGTALLTNATFNGLAVAAQGADYWVAARPSGYPANEQVYRWSRATLSAVSVGYGFAILVDEVRPTVRIGDGFAWFTTPFAVNANGEVGATRTSQVQAATTFDRLNLNANGPTQNINTLQYGAGAVDGRSGYVAGTSRRVDAGAGLPQGTELRVWRDALAGTYPTTATSSPGTNWVEATPGIFSPVSPDNLTWMAMAAAGPETVVVWVNESAVGGRRLRGARYTWGGGGGWTLLPGVNGAGDLHGSGDASRPSVEFHNGDILVGYYHTEAAATDVRVLRLRAGSATWQQLGGALSPTSPELERVELATLGETIWVSWSAPPGTLNRAPYVRWWDPRTSTWQAPVGTGPSGRVQLPGAVCISTRAGLGPTSDGAGMAMVYSPICTPATLNGLVLQEIR